MCMALIQPQVDFTFNHSFVPLEVLRQQNQPMVSRAGIAIKAALKEKGKTQGWLASEMDVSDNAVSKWIKTGQIARENISRVARLLDLFPEELLPENSDIGRVRVADEDAEKGAPRALTENASQADALAVHIEAIRQSAKVVADAFGLTADQVLAAALTSAGSQTAQSDEDILDHGRYRSSLADEFPAFRPTLMEERHYYSIEVNPYAERADTEQPRTQQKERRRS